MYLVDRSREKARTIWIYPYLQILSKLEPSEMHFCTVGWLVHIYNLWLHCETVTLSGTKVALPYDFHQLRSGNSNSQVVIGRSLKRIITIKVITFIKPSWPLSNWKCYWHNCSKSPKPETLVFCISAFKPAFLADFSITPIKGLRLRPWVSGLCLLWQLVFWQLF